MNQQPWRLGSAHASRSLQTITILLSCWIPLSVQAQVTPDDTLPEDSVVTPQGEKIQIEGGTTRGNNLFHSFQEFSVPNGKEAVFNNADSIENILSRVTGGSESVINGRIGANGTANVFLINPAGIIFGENASLNVGGSFIGSTADSLLFPDGIEYSATDADTPVLTINAPIGLGFRDAPQPITNSSLFDIDNFTGLSVPKDKTLALIGGDLYWKGGIISTKGGRIELGSVGTNSIVSLTEIDQGWDVGYKGVENFQNLNLTGEALVESKGADTGDIEVQARNLSVLEGSAIEINTSKGKAGNLRVFAAESVDVSGSSADSVGSIIYNSVENSASGAGSKLVVATKQLTVNNGGQIAATNSGSNQGGNIDLKATEILIGKPLIFAVDDYILSAIYTQTDSISTGDGGDINVATTRLKIEDGGAINTETLGSGNGGNLQINAVESVELTGRTPKSASRQQFASVLSSSVGRASTATGNAGDLTINTSTLKITGGAQISAYANNVGNGGVLTINADQSILLKGFAAQTEFTNSERSGIFVSAQPSFEDESGKIVTSTGNAGELNLATENLTVEEGAAISAGTLGLGDGGDVNLDVNQLVVRSGGEIRAASLIKPNSLYTNLDTKRGAGGTLNINAKDSVQVTGTGNINGEQVKSRLLVSGESNGEAGDINLNSKSLEVSNGGQISAATVAGEGGNIDLQIDDSIRLQEDSLISAAAERKASGGNIQIDTNFIIASPASPNGDNDIIASAGKEGTGGKIQIDAESVFGIGVRPQNEQTNDLDATGGVDGQVIINTPDNNTSQEIIDTPENLVEVERTVTEVCRNDDSGLVSNSLVVNGKGGVAPDSSAPLSSENLFSYGFANNQEQQSTIQPLQTASGEIMPARGVIRTASGKIILTPYPTENNQRVPIAKANCG